MPRIFDNIELRLLPALQDTLGISRRADFCVGYFNLRGWRQIDALIEPWSGGDDAQCRLLVGMQKMPHEELKEALSFDSNGQGIDQQQAARLKRRAAEEFRDQLMLGAPTNRDEQALRRLSAQLKARKVVVKLFLRHPLHAKLYLLFRTDPNNPITGFLGSSNLTLAGLSAQGELNVDVLDQDACNKLAKWFNDRWNDRWCLDISEELAAIIDTSWAREELIPPYHIYLKIAYHLSQEARSGVAEFRIPRDLYDILFKFQSEAVKIAAHHVNKRGGVLIGDVVGLGKTLTATALARIFQDDPYFWETLIICPKNLVKMWEEHVDEYRLIAKVLPISQVINELPHLRRYRLVVIDESHNLRNREGRRYRLIQEYIERNDSKVVLLSATPYNKTYLDLSAQLRLFLSEDQDLGIRPEKLLSEIGETEFHRRHQAGIRTLAAFEKSEYPDDWRDLMRLYLVRRTRSFIQDNYAETDPATGRKYLALADGRRSYFPIRTPRTLTFTIDDGDRRDPYARLFSDEVVQAVNGLHLPRYGLGNYRVQAPKPSPTAAEQAQLEGLSRAGKRLMGFSRTNLFKRLESGGPAFIQSVERHILRNYVFVHAIENGLDLPLGTQDPGLLDARTTDQDAELLIPGWQDDGDEEILGEADGTRPSTALQSEEDYRRRAAEVYGLYAGRFRRRFKWLRPSLFKPSLKRHLLEDARALLDVLASCGRWDPGADAKLHALRRVLSQLHPDEKVLIFTQFADTVHYLTEQLKALGIEAVEAASGDSADPTGLAWRFSPVSNDKRDRVAPMDELRVLIATDVLSEGQNLQDAAVVVNYDLPWAIIRLIQRAGRVDRIGQQSEKILVYSFLPADGVERILRLRARVRQRLRENAEVVGADEAFFEGEDDAQAVINLYNETAGILDGDADGEVDLASYAYQIWKNAITANPALKNTVESLPNVVFSTRAHAGTDKAPEGVLLYMRTAEDNDALVWMDRNGNSVTESQLAILQAAACDPDTPALPRHPNHHDLVQQGARHIAEEEKTVGGQLGRPSGARFRTYERLKRYAESFRGTLFESLAESQQLLKAIDEVYRYPLRPSAVDILNRQMKNGVDDAGLAKLVVALREDDRLCVIHEEERERDPRIICSLGLFASNEGS